MKTTRVFASACLLVSSIALITAASISVGDEPGVVRLSSQNTQAGGGQAGAAGQGFVPAPLPESGPAVGGSGVVYGDPAGPMPYPQPGNYAPYFERSFGATQTVPNAAYQPQEPFGPILMFESNIDNGLGYAKGFQRLNARIPYHVLPNTTVLMGDLSAAVTNNGDPLYNYGLVYRNYDQALNRIFGWNVFGDYDQGYGNTEWYRITAGLESLGKYIDWRANGYFIVGDDTMLLTDQLTGNLSLSGNNVFLLHQQTRENAYSGFDVETGGPLPLLGRYGLNMYVGGYYFGNDHGFDTPGFQARWEALITESIRVNTYLTTDDTFGTNSWVSMQFTVPNYRNNRVLRPANVRERLQDPVFRNNRVQTNIDTVIAPEAVVNAKTGQPWNITYVDPNAAALGTGTFENPFRTLQQAEDTNNALVDIIRVTPRADDTGTNLTANGGLHLFDCQVLLSSTKDFTLFNLGGQDFIIPGQATATNLGPLISNPTMAAGGSVVHLANQDQVIGMRMNAANAAGTVFGNGVSNALPITDVSLVDNTFTNYSVGANLQDITGIANITGNTFTGNTPVGTSQQGLLLTSAAGQTVELLLRNNTASNNTLAGLSVTAKAGSTINADDPLGNSGGPETGIVNNTLTANGNGIELNGQAGSVINAVVENNVIRSSTVNGLLATTNAGTFNLASLRGNLIVGNYDASVIPTTSENGVLLNYRNGGNFFAQSEDRNEDLNFNGILDIGEDTDADGVLDVANGILEAGEDLNGNGILDQGIVTNIMRNNVGVGLCIFGETAGNGAFSIGGPAVNLGNQLLNNGHAGLGIDLNGTTTAQVDSMFNRITDGAFQKTYSTQVQALFAMTGDTKTAPASLTNQSATGDITQFTWNLDRPAGTPDWEFDTTPDIALATIGTPFTVLNASDVTTGLGRVNDFIVPPYTASLQAALDRSQNLKLDFTGAAGFDPNEQLAFQIDVDPRGLLPDSSPDDLVNANQLAGTTGTVQFRDDFTGNGVQSLRTLSGTFVQSAADPLAVELQVNQSFSAPLFDTARQGDGVRVSAVDSAVITRFNSINDTVARNGGDGVSIVASDNARVDALTIQGATIEQNDGRGLNIEAHDNAIIQASSTIGGFDPATGGINIINGNSFTEANIISRNTSDGVRVLAADGGTVNGNLINNTIEENLGDGVALAISNGGTLDFGTPASNRVISRNTIQRNNGAGIRLTSNVSSSTQAQLNAVLNGNVVSQNGAGGLVANLNGPNNTPPNPPVVVDNNVLNLSVTGTAALPTNTFTDNGDVGIGVEVTGNGLANVDIRNATITGTTDGADPILNGDGINLRRADSSLLLANVEDVTSTGNVGDGLDLEVQGNDKNDPNQPLSGTVNTVDWNRNNLSNNGQNGARFRTRGEAMLIADGATNTLSGNGQNGILVQTSETSTFGDATDGLPPGRRVLFDGNTMTDNGVDGLQIVATENSRALVEVNSNAIAVIPGPHAALSSLGTTNISNNARDGVRITTTGGTSDIVITANTAQTIIDGNGTGVGGGNGVRWDASGNSDGNVRISRTTITNSIAGASEDTNGDGLLALNEDANLNGILDSGEDLNGNGVLDLGEDVNANLDLDVANGDGVQFNVSGTSATTLVVGELGEDLNLNGILDPGEDSNGNGVIDVGIGNMIQNNGDDGIAVTLNGSFNTGVPDPQIAIVGNTIGGEAVGLAAGNGGDGISFNTFGDRSSGSGDFVPELGPQGQLRVGHNLISQNDRRGANILLNGAGGIRDREGVGAGTFDPILVTFVNNDIVSNGEEGIFYQASPGYVQNRPVFLSNTGFPGDNRQPLFTGVNNIGQGTGNNANGSQLFYNPGLGNFTSLNVGSINGNTAYQAPYQNLATEQNSFLTVTNNVIQNNGTGTVSGEGLYIRVGTNAYVAADVQDNTFGGNLEEDFRTESFRYSANPDNLVDNTGIGTFDTVFLDDTAQFDLRFQNNSGNQILTESVGAAFTNGDVAKVNQPGVPFVLNRPVALFQVENGANLNNPNNTFINFGITQPINASFATGGYNIRAAADPGFPNIGFAPFLP